MNYLAIDAGWGGAVAYAARKRRKIYLGVIDCPGDCHGMLSFLLDLKEKWGDDWTAAIEANHASPIFGAKGNFGLGLNIGSWESALASVNIPWTNINPKHWQTLCSNERSGTKKGRKNRKEKAWRYARRTYPGLRDKLGDSVPNVRSPKQGRADALCILQWIRRLK